MNVRTSAPLLSIGVAVPHIIGHQQDSAARLAAIWSLKGAAAARWWRLNESAGIETRHSVMAPEEVVRLSTKQRMEAYQEHAPPLAAQAARRAMERAGITPEQITDLIVVSCTGFAAPGVDAALVAALDLKPSVRRAVIGFMGCFGAITGLRAAVGACAIDSEVPPVALVVCVELCSLHIRNDDGVQNQVASALFSDGAAAALVGSSNSSATASIGGLTVGTSLLIPEGREWMTWRITDEGFAMTLTRDVPNALRERLCQFVTNANEVLPQSFLIHPGGPGILDAANEALNLRGGSGIDVSQFILRRFGNMSSATILFVLDEAVRRAAPLPAMLLAFGPGLTIESLMLDRASRRFR